MNIIELPVSRLSYKIIRHDYGHTPITLHQRHPLWAAIVLPPRIKGRSEQCERFIPLALPPDVFIDRAAASRYLHNLHVERMMVWTQALHDNCLPARTAIQRFYDFYDLDDSDYDFSQTAYKAWQRWKDRHDEDCRKTPAKRATFSEKYVLRKSHLSQPAFRPLTDAELELRCDLIALRIFEQQPTAPDYIFRQVQLFIWKVEGGRSAEELAAKFGLHRANVYRAVGKVMHQARHDQNFRGVFE